jgi:hypothetical protein
MFGNKNSTTEEIRSALFSAVETLLKRDYDLVALGAHEQSISHRIAVYLETYFPKFHIDCEYNRQKHLSKTYCKEEGEEVATMRPDIIVHRRNDAHNNILALEMKANANADTGNDVIKLKALQTPEEGYCYRQVAFLRILNDLEDIKHGVLRATITWYGDDHKPAPEILITNNDCIERVIAIARLRISEKKLQQ